MNVTLKCNGIIPKKYAFKFIICTQIYNKLCKIKIKMCKMHTTDISPSTFKHWQFTMQELRNNKLCQLSIDCNFFYVNFKLHTDTKYFILYLVNNCYSSF